MLGLINKIKNLVTYRSGYPAIFVVVFFILIAILPLPAQAAFGPLLHLLGTVILWFSKFMGDLALAFIDMLINIAQYGDFINAPAVTKGWEVVRDVVNMFFIVVLLVIAFGSVFRIEEYQYNHLLSKLLITAVLVNFSKAITGWVIDVAQVVMLTFVNGFKDAARGNFVNGFRIADMFSFAQKAVTDNPAQGYSETAFFSAALLALITITITAVVVGVYLIVLTLRIVFLWFLIILAPLAFLLSAVPGKAHHYAEQWFEKFGSNVISGPILAFCLWLSLAVMQFTNANVLGSFSFTNNSLSPSVAITSIGQSDVLLSFIITVIMLLGGLYITEHLGVAGGGLAQSALHGIQHAGMAPFHLAEKGLHQVGHLAGHGVKELASMGWSEATARLGVEGSWEKWKEGWHKGEHKRDQDRQRMREKRISEHRASGSWLQFLGSPEYLFEDLWNTKTLKKVAKGGIGAISGEKYHKMLKERDKLMKEADDLGLQLDAPSGENRRVEAMKALGEIDQRLIALKLQEDSIDSGEYKKYLLNQAKSFDKQADKALSEGDIDKVTSLNKKAEEARKKAELPIVDQKKEILEERTKLKEEKQRQADISSKSIEELYIMARDETKEKIKKAKENLAELEANPNKLTAAQIDERDNQANKLAQQLAQLPEQLAAKIAALSAQGKSGNEIDEAVKVDKEFENSLREKISELRNGSISDREVKENTKQMERLRDTIKILGKKLNQAPLTIAERENIKEKKARLEDEADEINEHAKHYKPAEDYGLRRDQRSRINKEKSDMDTDNWQELLTIFEDAKHVGNVERMAAAYIKATESGNENEIQNAFGYYSDATGMKELINDIFIKEMGMAEQQALAIASDVSYTGERTKHWQVARAVNTKDGKLEWADEDNRQIEILAEVRKLDFEKFNREANRLAYGKEIVGYGEEGFEELGKDATEEERVKDRQKRAKHFRKGGDRGFVNSPFGETYLLENYHNLHKLLDGGRYNLNWAVTLTGQDGKIIKRMIEDGQSEGVIKEHEMGELNKIMEKIKKFAGTEQEEGVKSDAFRDVKKLIELWKQRA